MKPFISTSFYGVANYILAFAMILAPWYIPSITGSLPALWIKPSDAGLAFYHVGGASLFLILIIGWLEFIMAVFSNNSHGLIKQFPMQMHHFLDVLMGLFLFFSPFIYGYSDKVWWPQMLAGGLLCILGIFTKNSPFTTKPHHPRPQGGLTSVDYEEGSLMN